ncbi:MAG: AmmeMemoRadiSam system radical SAM enzyme [Spirochaetales bacterium]|nr:AmmeMemoRadiSam system radical SAM enzyme [Spirochaetales bacterium]
MKNERGNGQDHASEQGAPKEAALYEKLPENKVRCNLCAHRCLIGEGHKGICRVRENRGGTLYTLVYGRTISEQIDPIEKKPLYHFYPGSRAYSIATPGCNFRCRWCQNWEISQMPRKEHMASGRDSPPQQVVAAARESGCRSVAYTYTEPTVFFEYAYDTARLAHAAGLANLYITNGFMTPEMLETFRPYLDAANVDLKAFREETYRRYTGGRLGPILENMKLMKKLGIWLEVTTLVIPGINDEEQELRDAARFVIGELGAETPWHISRFFPSYEMADRPPTPMGTLRKAREIGKEEGLRYVYLGNVGEESDTFCHHCGELLVRRSGHSLIENRVRDGRCPSCGTPVAGIGMTGGA